YVCALQNNIECYEKWTSTNSYCTSSLVNRSGANVWSTFVVRPNLITQQFKCATSYIFEVHTILALRRPLIEVDWDRQFRRDSFTGLVSDLNALLNGRTHQRN